MLRLRDRMHKKDHPAVCMISGRHHVEWVLAPMGRRYVQRCVWCGTVWDVPQGRMP